MADNTELNPGTGGDTIAADEIAAVKFQRVKVALGADGSNDGDVATANPMPAKLPVLSWNAPTFVSVGTSTTVVLASNASRKGAVIVNDSVNVIYLGIGAAAVLNRGIRLNPEGGTYEIDAANLCTQAINGISAVAAQNLTVHEAV